MLIEKMKVDRMKAMKEKNKVDNSKFNLPEVKMNLLSTLIGDACKVDKNPRDEKVIATIKSFLKNADELQDVLKNTSNDTTQVDVEIEILNGYLPTQLTEGEIRAIIVAYIAESVDNCTTYNLGSTMSYFKSYYVGQYDGAMVSKIVKEML